MIDRSSTASVFAAALAASAWTAAADAGSASKFDGPWSVAVYTTMGSCQPSTRFSGQIVNGEISYAYGSPEVVGRVEASGATKVNVTYGDARGEAHGVMTATQGSGTWSGDSPNGRCAGTWDASRK